MEFSHFPEPVERRTYDGKNVCLTAGSYDSPFTCHHLAEIEGKTCFLKSPWGGGEGSNSRTIISNEIQVMKHLKESGSDHPLYVGYSEIDGQIVLIYQYRDDMETLADFIGVDKIDSENDGLGIVAEYISQLEIPQVVLITKNIAQQIHAYHNSSSEGVEGVIHMDIHPSNVLITDELDEIVLVDFGISSKKGGEINRLFCNVGLKGVFGPYYSDVGINFVRNSIYSPPDLGDYEVAEPSIDTYNIVNMFCLMLTGRLVEFWQHRGEDVSNVMVEQRSVSAELASSLANIVTQGVLGKNERYQTASDLIDDLDEISNE